MSGTIVIAYGIVALLQNMLVYLMVRTGLNRTFRDPGMTVGQITFGTLVQAAFIVMAPEVGVFFLVNLFNCFLFSVLALSARQFFHVWAFGAVTTAVAFISVGDRIGFPNSSGLTQAIMWTCFLLALGKIDLSGKCGQHIAPEGVREKQGPDRRAEADGGNGNP